MIIKGKRSEPAPEEEPLLPPAHAQARESALIKNKGGPSPVQLPLPAAPRSSLVKRGTYVHTEADAPPPESRPEPPQADDRVAIPTGDRPVAPPSPVFGDAAIDMPAAVSASVGPPLDQQILEEAKRRAEAIMRQAQLDAKKLLEESRIHCQNALQQAEQEGFQQGQQRGFQEGTARLDALIGQVRMMLVETVYARERVIRGSEGALAELALAIARRVTQNAVAENPEVIKKQVAEALEKVKDREHITVRVHPQDLDVVRARRDVFHKLLEGPKTFDINGDPKVDRGGVIIETNLGNVDARISTQMQALELVLDEVQKRMQLEWERVSLAAAQEVRERGLPPHLAAQAQMVAAPEPPPLACEAAPVWSDAPAEAAPPSGHATMGQTFVEEGGHDQ